jgi:hypothetical protein
MATCSPMTYMHGNRTRLVLALALLLPLRLSAQVSVESLQQDELPLGRSGSFGGDLIIRTGNVDFVQIGLNARLFQVTESVTTLMVGNGGFGLLGGSRFASSSLIHLRQTFRSDWWLSPEWYGQMNYDRAQLLNFRILTGAGGRISFISEAWGQFGAGSGLMVEHERLNLPATASHPDQTTTIRWNNFLTLRVVPNENLVVTSTTYLQPSLGDFGDSRALENLRIAASITEVMAITVSFDLRYDGKPPDGITSLDTSLRTGVTFTY